MSNSTHASEKIKNWNYLDAQKTTKYIQLCLNDLRVSIIRLRHLFRAYNFNRSKIQQDPEFSGLLQTGKKTFLEFNQINIVVYDRAYRGIALYPFIVFYDDGIGLTPRNAYYIYKDTRTTIDHYAFVDELEKYNDLSASEKIIPEEWKTSAPTIKISKNIS